MLLISFVSFFFAFAFVDLDSQWKVTLSPPQFSNLVIVLAQINFEVLESMGALDQLEMRLTDWAVTRR